MGGKYRQFDLVQHFKQHDGHGNGLIIKGGVRRGKTYLLGIFARLLLDNGFVVIANVRFDNEVYRKYPTKLFYLQNDLDYFNFYLNIPKNQPIVVMWDDIQAQDGFKSTQVIRSSGEQLSKFLIFLGKFDSNYIYVAHQKYIPDCILDGYEPLFIYKHHRRNFYVCEEWHERIKDLCHDCQIVPVPTPKQYKGLPILSKAISEFEFVLPLSDLYKYLSRYDIGEDLRRGVKEFLDSYESDDKYNNPYDELKSLSYEKIYMALCLKKGEILPDGNLLRDLINPKIINEARKKLKKFGL
jgi:hypothetical protein